MTKRYLLDLAAAGLDVVPTVLLDERPSPYLAGIMAGRGWAQAVLKPLASASGHDTVIVTAASAGEVATELRAGRLRRPAMLQPFEIRRGEWSLVFADGEFTHAVLKRPAEGDFRVQPRYGGKAAAAEPSPALLAAAQDVMRALPGRPLYARVDRVEREGRLLVMEVELNEPGLLYQYAPGAAGLLADAIIRWLGAAGVPLP